MKKTKRVFLWNNVYILCENKTSGVVGETDGQCKKLLISHGGVMWMLKNFNASCIFFKIGGFQPKILHFWITVFSMKRFFQKNFLKTKSGIKIRCKFHSLFVLLPSLFPVPSTFFPFPFFTFHLIYFIPLFLCIPCSPFRWLLKKGGNFDLYP